MATSPVSRQRSRVAALALACTLPLAAQAHRSAAEGIAEYGKLLEDGNPAELREAEVEALWTPAHRLRHRVAASSPGPETAASISAHAYNALRAQTCP